MARPPAREIRDVSELTEWLRPLAGRNRVVAIDGVNGSGKSTLAKAIASSLGLVPIHIDDYLTGDGRPYTEQLRVGVLEGDLRQVLARGIVVEGIGILDVLGRANIKASTHVYMVYQDQQGQVWKADLCAHERIQDAIEYNDLPPAGTVDRYIFDYHHQRSPRTVADFIFVRVSDDPEAMF